MLSRRVFGAIGLYCDGAFFGIIAGDARYFRVDAETRAACQAQGSRPFKPYADRPDDDAVLEAVRARGRRKRAGTGAAGAHRCCRCKTCEVIRHYAAVVCFRSDTGR